jgi:hypothetical protein
VTLPRRCGAQIARPQQKNGNYFASNMVNNIDYYLALGFTQDQAAAEVRAEIERQRQEAEQERQRQ